MDKAQLQQNQGVYCFGAFRLDVAECRLWYEEDPVPLTPKQFELLFYFVGNAGRVVKKNELLDAVWADAYVEEATLARNVSWLRKLFEDRAGGTQIIETVPKLGYRFTAQVTRLENNGNPLIFEEQTARHFWGAEVIALDSATVIDEQGKAGYEEAKKTNSFPLNILPSRLSLLALAFLFFGGIAFVVFAGDYGVYRKYFKAKEQTTGSNVNEKVAARNVAEKAPIKVGSIVHLRNQSSNTAGYLDAWGLVKNKPEFSIVPTGIMFVATHQNPNRQNGSGSWGIVSATGKQAGEILVYGDKIHLRNMYPQAGYLDNCGWVKDMPVFKKFSNLEKFAVFTAYSENRDNGTGTWIVSSDTKFDGDPVFEGDGIALENGFPGGGFLNAAAPVGDVPAFNDYDGSLLVFIHQSSAGRHPKSGIWLISGSQAALK